MKEALIILSSYIIIGVIFWISLYIYRIFLYKKKHWNNEKFTEFYVREDYESDIVLSIFWIIVLPIGLCVIPLYGIKLLIHKIFKVY
jgi:hypothetical protein